MYPRIGISMLIFGLFLWASLLSIVEAIPVSAENNVLKRVRWGVNKERLYRLPEGLVARSTITTTNPAFDNCKCGQCRSCVSKRMMRSDSEERLFGLGSTGYGYDPYGSSMGYDPYYNPQGSYYPQYYETYGYDPYFSQQYQYQEYPQYW